MSKFTTLFMVALILFFSLTYAARPDPALAYHSPAKTQHEVLEGENVDGVESCDGIGEEECLTRRTLTAHIDYIYTQKTKP